MSFSLRRKRTPQTAQASALRSGSNRNRARNKRPGEVKGPQELPPKISQVAPGKEFLGIWSTLGQIRRSLELVGMALTLLAAICFFLLVAVAIVTTASDKRLLIDKIELPESVLKAGIGPERLELMLQEAMHLVADFEGLPSSLPDLNAGQRLLQTQLKDPLARLQGQGMNVVWAGNVLSMDRLAYWVKSTFDIGEAQSLVSLRLAELESGQINLHVHVRHSDKTQGYWALTLDDPSVLLEPQSNEMQRFAFYVLLASNPVRAIQILLDRDSLVCNCISDETVELLDSQASRLTPYQRFWLLTRVFDDAVDDPYTYASEATGSGRLARFTLRTRRELPDAPWQRASGEIGVRSGECESVDKKLFQLARTQEDRLSYDHDVSALMEQCIKTNLDLPTFTRVDREGLFKRAPHRKEDTRAIVRGVLLQRALLSAVLKLSPPPTAPPFWNISKASFSPTSRETWHCKR